MFRLVPITEPKTYMVNGEAITVRQVVGWRHEQDSTPEPHYEYKINWPTIPKRAIKRSITTMASRKNDQTEKNDLKEWNEIINPQTQERNEKMTTATIADNAYELEPEARTKTSGTKSGTPTYKPDHIGFYQDQIVFVRDLYDTVVPGTDEANAWYLTLELNSETKDVQITQNMYETFGPKYLGHYNRWTADRKEKPNETMDTFRLKVGVKKGRGRSFVLVSPSELTNGGTSANGTAEKTAPVRRSITGTVQS